MVTIVTKVPTLLHAKRWKEFGTFAPHQTWDSGKGVPWTVAIDETNQMFKDLCGGTTTPCSLVQTPNEGVIYKHIGLAGVKELEALTGPWK